MATAISATTATAATAHGAREVAEAGADPTVAASAGALTPAPQVLQKRAPAGSGAEQPRQLASVAAAAPQCEQKRPETGCVHEGQEVVDIDSGGRGNPCGCPKCMDGNGFPQVGGRRPLSAPGGC
jgi:hypothetical protein